MPTPRQRTIWYAIVAIALAWTLALTGFFIARKSKQTAERVQQFMDTMNLRSLSAAERAKRLHELVDKLNSLSPEERRKWHLDRDFFRELTDEERMWFIDAVLPSEMHVVLDMFDQMPKEQRQQQIDKALEELRAHPDPKRDRGTNAITLSPEVEKQIRTVGLKSFYSGSSAQAKAELMPLLLEVQHQFDSGRGLKDFDR
jgi:hypothetical protein